MGIIIKQSIKGSIWSYIGVGIGFVTTAYLYPNYLSTDLVGLFGLLLSYAVLLAQFSSLGINGATSRLFPYFRNKKKEHNGYLFIALIFGLAGFLIFLSGYYFFAPWLVESNLEKSKLFADYVFLLIPFTFFTLFFNILDTYNKLLFNAVFGIFLQEFLQRFLILLVVLLFAVGFINTNQLIYLFTVVVCLKTILIWGYLKLKGEFFLTPRPKVVTTELRRELVSVAAFSMLTGVGGSIVFSIDKIVVNQMLGLSATGIYSIAFFFGTLVIIPSRPLLRISGTLIAEAWKRNDKEYIAEIYQKSCINQFIIAAFIFGGIWINIENIQVILGPDYEGAKWVIFFIGLSNLIEMATGSNAHIIAFSKYYRVALYFLMILIVFVFATMFLFIPVYGIVGAAIAIVASMFAYNLMRYIFILIKFRMQPFGLKFLLVPVSFFMAYFLAGIMNQQPLVTDILIRSIIFSIIFGGTVLLFRTSDDVNLEVKKVVTKLGLKK